MSKKDNGKGIQKADGCKIAAHPGTFEDIQIPLQNNLNSTKSSLPYQLST